GSPTPGAAGAAQPGDRRWLEWLASRYTLVQYDPRGLGLSDRATGTNGLEGVKQTLARGGRARAPRRPRRAARGVRPPPKAALVLAASAARRQKESCCTEQQVRSGRFSFSLRWSRDRWCTRRARSPRRRPRALCRPFSSPAPCCRSSRVSRPRWGRRCSFRRRAADRPLRAPSSTTCPATEDRSTARGRRSPTSRG